MLGMCLPVSVKVVELSLSLMHFKLIRFNILWYPWTGWHCLRQSWAKYKNKKKLNKQTNKAQECSENTKPSQCDIIDYW